MIFDTHDDHQRDWVRKLSIVGRHDEVTRPAQHQPSGDALTLDGRDRGFRDVTPALRVFQVAPGLPVVVILSHQLSILGAFGTKAAAVCRRVAARHVVAGRKVLTGRGEHDHPHIRVLVRAPPSVVEVLENARCLRVRGLRPVKGDHRHRPVHLVTNEMFCCHCHLLYLKLLITLSWANEATRDPACVYTTPVPNPRPPASRWPRTSTRSHPDTSNGWWNQIEWLITPVCSRTCASPWLSPDTA